MIDLAIFKDAIDQTAVIMYGYEAATGADPLQAARKIAKAIADSPHDPGNTMTLTLERPDWLLVVATMTLGGHSYIQFADTERENNQSRPQL